MRIQTMFGRISAGTDERVFGSAIVLLRIAFGVLLAVFVFDVGREFAMLSPGTVLPEVILALWSKPESLLAWMTIPLFLVSLSYILGLFTRPAGILLLTVLAVMDIALLPFPLVKSLLVPELLVVSVALLGVAGGLGNAFGFNGVILRNIRNPGVVIKFLLA